MNVWIKPFISLVLAEDVQCNVYYLLRESGKQFSFPKALSCIQENIAVDHHPIDRPQLVSFKYYIFLHYISFAMAK